MDLVFTILWPFVLSVLVIIVFGCSVYLFRRTTIKSEVRMTLFLDKRFDVIRRNGLWGKESDFIDEVLIRRWGNTGWVFLGLPAIIFDLDNGGFFSVGGFLSFVILFIGGLLLGDSRVAVYFLRRLGSSTFRVEDTDKGLP